MKFSSLLLLLFSIVTFAQQPGGEKIKLSGTVLEKTTKQPLEYATITLFRPNSTKPAGGGITDPTGKFSFDIAPGTYDIKIEFISFSSTELKSKALTSDTDLGKIELAEDATMLNEVVVRAEATTVDIRLDKKVYNVGQDLMVKGGTVSDVLDNIPSVSVDAEGVVSLRGNENVRILIDGRPSNAINVAEALRNIPADAIEKVEVVTNPSARYDAEGGGGLLNIILKKGKNQGVNGTIIANASNPEGYGISANINYKTDKFNLYTTTGYNYRSNPGNSITNTEYLDSLNMTRNYIDESRENERVHKGYNSNFGIDLYLDKTLTWSNALNIRRYTGENPETVLYRNYDVNHDFVSTNSRFNDQHSNSTDMEYSTNITKNFDDKGHKLTINGAFSQDRDHDDSMINNGVESTLNDQKQNRNVIQADYVRPIGKDSQFEFGYKGDFNTLLTDFSVDTLNTATNQYNADLRYTNTLQYKEKINALYTQYGTKFNKFSVLLGIRYENSNIDINQFTTREFNNKQYDNFMPSAFLTYELSDKSSISLSYSRRIQRPRGRMINPFSNYSSNINIFRGNPDLDPSLTNAFDLGYLQKWNKLTLSTSMYLNRTTDAFEFIRTESGDFVTTVVDGADTTDPTGNPVIVGGEDIHTPVILTTPINLGVEYRFGFEFTLNYSPYKWWKINSNFNLFRNETQGDYSYVNSADETITQNFDNTSYSWFTRLTSKVSLPYGIDWQTNVTYNGPQTSSQGRSRGTAAANLAFSKDILKDKATIGLNVQDLFNSRKRIYETHLDGVLNSYNEMQWRTRQVNLSFTYRFNRKKNEKDPSQKPNNGNDNGGEEYPQ